MIDKFGLVHTQWHKNIIDNLKSGALLAFNEYSKYNRHKVIKIEVAGALEIPLACQELIDSGVVYGIVALGCIIRGETSHYDLVSKNCFSGIMQVQLETSTPIGIGVLAVENMQQAVARSAKVTDCAKQNLKAGQHNAGFMATKAMLKSYDNNG